MISGERMQAVDENAAALGVTRKQLMESSGNAVARTVRSVAEAGSRVLILAGRGNNGGDAFVAARFLESFETSVVLLGRPRSIGTEIARENWEALQEGSYHCKTVTDSADLELPETDIIIDGMLGTGVSGHLREPVATAAEAINGRDATVVSIDVPTGFDAEGGTHADGMVVPDHVVTFHATKPGLDALEASITVADIGIPAAAERVVGPGDRRAIVSEERTGRSLVVGGGPYTGAPALAAEATLASGMELTFVSAPSGVARDIQGYGPDLIVRSYEGDVLETDHVPALVEEAERYDDIVILGPGIGQAVETREAVQAFLGSFTGRAVVDADALSVVPECSTDATLVCTPNRAELAAMGGPEVENPSDAVDAIESFTEKLGHVVLVKGRTDVISDGVRTRVNRTGTPGMAVGGTGDVLAGIVAALLATARPIDAAAVGAYVNGRAGERLADRAGHGGTASAMLEEVAPAMYAVDE